MPEFLLYKNSVFIRPNQLKSKKKLSGCSSFDNHNHIFSFKRREFVTQSPGDSSPRSRTFTNVRNKKNNFSNSLKMKYLNFLLK